MIQIICYVISISGILFTYFAATDPVGNGIRRMIERPWWFNWMLVLIGICICTITLVEVRSRNGGIIDAKVIGQTLLWIGITVGGLMFVWYLRGDFS
ncbi:hypothetical protein [Pseudalkalibacillus berkeleyi]|uniref:Uncharacterized protein n=1 Tax=Pseudalkalibacillus berkeleyi TaxID=1069813 RepID=A0ABS9H609_9BACL|nr:hypothetical protein [Pseudalkalibacillus berkeleyi]MCF6139561.1 hypothetical protein [Pseudalkalibacillus berkeleyi]